MEAKGIGPSLNAPPSDGAAIVVRVLTDALGLVASTLQDLNQAYPDGPT